MVTSIMVSCKCVPKSLQNKYLFSNNNIYTKNIIFYSRYVDDTFIIYNGTNRQLDKLIKYLNNISSNIQFTIVLENNNKLNILDLTLTKNNNKFQFNIYRKPTTTDIVIPADSHHPRTHKMASFNSLLHRLLISPLNDEDFKEEISTLKYKASANGYNSEIITD